MKELVSVVDWEMLLLHMGMEKFENDKTKANNPGNVDAQKMDAFDKWLKRFPDACWKTVIDALYDQKYIVLANKLERKFNWKDPRVCIVVC